MSTELKKAAEKALVVLGSATSFMPRKARDQHESVVAELRTAIQQAEAQQPATPKPIGYMNEGHLHELAMKRLPYGYVYPEAGVGASTAVYIHPAPIVPDAVVRDAERYRWLRRKACVIGKTTYCGEETGQPILDFVNLPDVTEVIRRDSASTLDAAIDAAMLAAKVCEAPGSEG